MKRRDMKNSEASTKQLRIEFGKYIQKHRKQKGYTQQQLAEMLGVTSKSISCNERGDTFPDYENIFRLAKILDMSLDEFVFGYKCFESELSLSEMNELMSGLDMESKRMIIETVSTMCRSMAQRRQQ